MQHCNPDPVFPDLDLTPDAAADYYFEPDYVQVTFRAFEILTDKAGKALLQPVEVEAEEVVLEIKISVETEVSCHFSLSAYDSIDREYVSMASTTATIGLDFEAEILLTLSGDFDKGLDEVEITDYELLSLPTDVDFGYIEPDWSDD